MGKPVQVIPKVYDRSYILKGFAITSMCKHLFCEPPKQYLKLIWEHKCLYIVQI